ncbi:POK7 protein, partial [Crypturellus soui]|nr:POK7 protein [Crypturellus soui]
VELAEVTWAFENFKKELNVGTDSAYIAGVVAQIERAHLKEVANPHLFSLLRRLQRALEERVKPYFITHVRSHTALPGPIAEGNRIADRLTAASVLPDLMKQAELSHQFFHQNARTLKRMFGLTVNQAQDITSACPDCQMQQTPPVVGANP